MVYVTGDIHGWLDIGKLTPARWPEGQKLLHSDFLVICGDFGLLWTNPPTLEEKFFLDWLDAQPWTTLFVDGNHENYDIMDKLPTCTWHGGRVSCIPGHKNVVHLRRGQVYEMGSDGRWFVMGGAPSHDMEWREEGKSWWAREMPSQEEYDEALHNLERVGWQVDYVFTHEVPRQLRRHAMARNWDPSRVQDDELTAFLQTVDERLDKRRLKMWYAGHYHDDIMLRDPKHAELYQQIVPLGALPDAHMHRHVPFYEDSWEGVDDLGKRYREWVLSRQMHGCTISWQDNEHIRITTDHMFGVVTFYAIPSSHEIVELRITQLSDGVPAFFTRFALDDMFRAKELFLEMCEVLQEVDSHGNTHVLLCCEAGVSTTAYVEKLRHKACALSLHLDFFAQPLDDAIAAGRQYDVVLVAPQVGYRYRDAVLAFPHAIVVEIPNEVFAHFNGKATMRLVLDAIAEGVYEDAVGTGITAARPLAKDKDVMVVSVTNHLRATTIGYRVFSQGHVTLDGLVRKRHVDLRDIHDLLVSLRLDGLAVEELDAVGITLPGIINHASVSLPSDDVSDYKLVQKLTKRFGTKVFVDNNANAAAMGCYMAQSEYKNVVFHSQHTGSVTCAEGVVLNGRLTKGRHNCAGELLPIMGKLRYSDDPTKLVWTFEGMREVVASYLLAPICSVAPDAVFVYVPLLHSMEALHGELEKTLPKSRIPQLVCVADHRELIYLGELALCIEKLEIPTTSHGR